MTASTTVNDRRDRLGLELAIIRLARAVDRLNGSVRQLAEKEYLDPADRDDRYRRIVESLADVSHDLQEVAAALSEEETNEPVG